MNAIPHIEDATTSGEGLLTYFLSIRFPPPRLKKKREGEGKLLRPDLELEGGAPGGRGRGRGVDLMKVFLGEKGWGEWMMNGMMQSGYL